MDFSRLLTHLKTTHWYGRLKAALATILTRELRDQDRAFRNFFEGRARYPRFRKRGNGQAVHFQIDQRQARAVGAWRERRVVVSAALIKVP